MPAARTAELTITNPLVLYRSLLATKRIEPDPAQHRLALHLEKLYNRLKDYDPPLEYGRQLRNLKAELRGRNARSHSEGFPERSMRLLSSLQWRRQKAESLALVRRWSDVESAVNIQSPQGLMVHGDVGTGKSMIIDLLADCLPNRKKRRWHFDAFLLEIFARLERVRAQNLTDTTETREEHSLVSVAADLMIASPIIFLDEFQLPDRAAARILTRLFTAFFVQGGVLVATSNRMPEELANAFGSVSYSPPRSFSMTNFRQSILGDRPKNPRDLSRLNGDSDMENFYDVVRARCEVYSMEGQKDWRRLQNENSNSVLTLHAAGRGMVGTAKSSSLTSSSQLKLGTTPRFYHVNRNSTTVHDGPHTSEDKIWNLLLLDALEDSTGGLNSLESPGDIQWKSMSIRVYGRTVRIQNALKGVTLWNFSALCGSNMGPADYTSLASTFHTFILTDLPILPLLRKNEARRFITFLDALYESRCKLLIRASAGPDDIFFPEMNATQGDDMNEEVESDNEEIDSIHTETLSEIYQEQKSPFRPNVSRYEPSASTPEYDASPLPQYLNSKHNTRSSRSILADEDSDFGPIYEGERSLTFNQIQNEKGSDELHETRKSDGPDFRRLGAFTGEDEKFAYKRAQSRLWQMCGEQWWSRHEKGWWRPLSKEVRTWENPSAVDTPFTDSKMAMPEDGVDPTSPFRTISEPPPRIAWTHAWGLVKWGKKAGLWGKGVDGLLEGNDHHPRKKTHP